MTMSHRRQRKRVDVNIRVVELIILIFVFYDVMNYWMNTCIVSYFISRESRGESHCDGNHLSPSCFVNFVRVV